MARPTKYDADKMLSKTKTLKLMKSGASKTEVAAELGINRDTLYEWCDRYQEFSDTIKKGRNIKSGLVGKNRQGQSYQ